MMPKACGCHSQGGSTLNFPLLDPHGQSPPPRVAPVPSLPISGNNFLVRYPASLSHPSPYSTCTPQPSHRHSTCKNTLNPFRSLPALPPQGPGSHDRHLCPCCLFSSTTCWRRCHQQLFHFYVLAQLNRFCFWNSRTS